MNRQKKNEPTRSARPDWLRVKLASGGQFASVNAILNKHRLNTVCRSANCPNRGECFSRGTATFLILGPNCTRSCRFCDVTTGATSAVDFGEAVRVAEASREMNLRHVVITSVTRDDLPDGGSAVFAAVIKEIRNRRPECIVEVLTPDFGGSETALKTVMDAGPDIFNHNIETVARLYPDVRPGADYDQSLRILTRASEEYDVLTKSGLMVGLGETTDELIEAFDHLANAGVSYLTIGQYLSPSDDHLPVVRYIPPEEFDRLSVLARRAGISKVFSGPLVRSSYMADHLHHS